MIGNVPSRKRSSKETGDYVCVLGGTNPNKRGWIKGNSKESILKKYGVGGNSGLP